MRAILTSLLLDISVVVNHFRTISIDFHVLVYKFCSNNAAYDINTCYNSDHGGHFRS